MKNPQQPRRKEKKQKGKRAFIRKKNREIKASLKGIV